MGDLDMALDHLLQAVEHFPRDPFNRLVYAKGLIAKKDYQTALGQIYIASHFPRLADLEINDLIRRLRLRRARPTRR